MNDLEGKAAVVTGASRGIGRAIAERLAQDGALVAVHYGQNAGLAHEVVAGIAAKGGRAFALGSDFGAGDGVARFFEQLDRELISRAGSNEFDVLVNNAAVAPFVSFAETDETTFDRVFEVNVKSLYFVTQGALARLRDGGRVINLSSVVSRAHFPGIPAYAASKGAVDTLTLHLAQELGERGITVNAVAPGAIDTDMSAWLRTDEGEVMAKQIQALKRKGQPDDIARVVAFLASPGAGWITGRVIDASGGTKL